MFVDEEIWFLMEFWWIGGSCAILCLNFIGMFVWNSPHHVWPWNEECSWIRNENPHWMESFNWKVRALVLGTAETAWELRLVPLSRPTRRWSRCRFLFRTRGCCRSGRWCCGWQMNSWMVWLLDSPCPPQVLAVSKWIWRWMWPWDCCRVSASGCSFVLLRWCGSWTLKRGRN